MRDLPINVLSSLPKNSVYYTVNDSTRFGIWYMQGVYNIRPDVIAVWPFQPKWYRKQLSKRYKNIPRLPHHIKPQQFGGHNFYTDMLGGPFSNIYRFLSPEGLVYKVNPGPVSGLESAVIGRRNLLEKYRYHGIYNTGAHRYLFNKEVIWWYGEAHNNVGATFQNNGFLEEAIEMYSRSISMMPESFVAYFNLGLIYRHKGDYLKAVKMFKTSIEKDPAFLEAY